MLPVMLIDDRIDPEPEPGSGPGRSVPWRVLGKLVAALVLILTAGEVGGLVGYVFVLASVTLVAHTLDRWLGSWTGLSEHRQ